MDQRILGIHHVTAIAGDPQGNVDFYAGVLGLRLVKKTVNFDDPATYHLYYGDEAGNPGTLLTFFPWPGARRGRQGTGQVSVVSLSIPQFSLGYWLERLITHGVRYEGPTRRFDEQVVAFRDPDGLALDLVTDGAVHDRSGWGAGPVPADHAIRGVSSVTLWEEGYELTARLLTETLGFRLIREDGNRFRFGVGSGVRGRRSTSCSHPTSGRGSSPWGRYTTWPGAPTTMRSSGAGGRHWRSGAITSRR